MHNKRLVPLLSRAEGQLQVKLVARSARPGELKALREGSVKEAGFVLKGCKIAATVAQKTVDVVGEGMVQRGVAEVGVVETYGEDGEDTVDIKSLVEIIKKDVEA